MLALGLTVPSQGTAPPIRVVVDDVPLSVSPPAFLQDGTVYLPLAALARRFQATTKFNAPTVEVHRIDDSTLTLRLDRLEVWSGDVVTTLLDAPVRLVNGATMIPRGAVDALFDTLTTWDPQEGLVSIVTRAPFQTAVAAKPPRPPQVTAPVPTARPFALEFQQDLTPPVTSSGYIAVGLTSGAGTLSATATVQYKSFGAPENIEGLLRVGVGNGPLDASGVVVLRNPAYTFTVGGLVLDESPFTLYQQGILGVAYEGNAGASGTRFFGGSLADSSSQVYGMTMLFPQSGPWQSEVGLLYDPTIGVLLTRVRADREMAPGLAIFGETALGASGPGSGPAWRIGAVASSPTLSTSLSYLVVGADFPAVGNATLFTGRSGPLLQLAYMPDPRWTISSSAALLDGSASGLPNRQSYDLLMGFRPAPGWGIALGTRLTDDVATGVSTRNVGTQAAAFYTQDRWTFTLAANQNDTTDLLTSATSSSATFRLQTMYALETGLPAWAEISRQIGATESWGVGTGWSFRLSSQLDLIAQLQNNVFTLPTEFSQTIVELSVSSALPGGARLSVGPRIQFDSTGSTTTSLSVQYGYPIMTYGIVPNGRLEGVVFQDRNENGRQDPDEPGVPGVIMRIEGRRAAISDRDGRLSIDALREGEYRLTLDGDTVPVGLVTTQPRITVQVTDGARTNVEFALVSDATLSGIVYLDADRNGVRDPDEEGIGGVVFELQGPRQQFATSTDDGTFAFSHLPPGDYTLVVNPASLPPDVHMEGSSPIKITLRPGASIVLNVPVPGKPIIKQTFP